MAGALSLVERVLHKGAGLGQQLRSRRLAIETGFQAREPDSTQGSGDDDCSRYQPLAVVDPAPERRERRQDDAEHRDYGGFGK